ncbi:MAG: matrixin family metalloprotease [Actinobacteria bacterium]|nr:matrixin family metalloprotease [Actinomycetota bacterium]
MARVRLRWNRPPGWPTPPPGWTPPRGWTPPPEWPEPPPGWQFFVPMEPPVEAVSTGHPAGTTAPPPRRNGRGRALAIAATAVATIALAAAVATRADVVKVDAGVAAPVAIEPVPESAGDVRSLHPATDAPPEPADLAAADPTPAAAMPQAPPTFPPDVPEPAGTTAGDTDFRWPGFPPPGLGEQAVRVLPRVEATAGGAFRFVQTQPNGAPVGYSPCRVWPVVVNTAGAPPGAYAQVVEAVAIVSRTTGVAFRVEGTTDEPYSSDRPAYQPDRYGDRWAPILVVWAPDDRDSVAGHGGSRAVTMSDTRLSHFVTGFAAIDSTDPQNRDPDGLKSVLLHELGHVVGLGHSDDPRELMAPIYRGQPGFGPGDLAGLAAVGTVPCAPQL